MEFKITLRPPEASGSMTEVEVVVAAFAFGLGVSLFLGLI